MPGAPQRIWFNKGVGIESLSPGVRIGANSITGNVPSGQTAVSGGVAVLSEPGGIPAERNTIAGDLLAGNDPDIFWDQSGTGNSFTGNACKTSVPSGLC